MDNWLLYMAVAGILLSLLPLGSCLLAGSSVSLPRFSSVQLQIAIASAAGLWTLFLIAAGLASQFHLLLFGVVGWAVTIVCVFWHYRRHRANNSKIQQAAAGAGSLDRTHALIAGAIIVAAFAFYFSYPKESLLGERDEGIYAQHALHLSHQGTSRVDISAHALADNAEAANRIAGTGLPGLYPTGTDWTFQFSAATPVWMALLASAFGDLAIFRFNAILGLLNCLAFYSLARLHLGKQQRAWALAALAVFAFNPVQIWISRNTLSEPLAAWFILSGLLAATLALTETRRRMAVVAGGLLGAAAFVRIDGSLVLPSLLAAWTAARAFSATRPGEQSDRAFRQMAIACAIVVLAAMVYYGLFVTQYFIDTSPQLIGAGLLIAGLAGLPRVARFAAVVRWVSDRRQGLITAGLVLVTVTFIYGLHVRPHIGSHSLIDSTLVTSFNGARDHREDSLQRLAGYLFLPIIYLSWIGVLFWLRRLSPPIIAPHALAVPAILLLPAMIPLWNPMVSPDLIWGSRRWVPFLLPAVALFAAFGAAGLTSLALRSRGSRLSIALPIIATAVASAALLHSQKDTLFFREDRHLLRQVEAIADYMPKNQVSYIIGNDPLVSALFTAYDAPVASLQAPSGGAIAASELGLGRECAPARPCYVLHPRGLIVYGNEGTLVGYGAIRRQRRDRGTTVIPRGTHDESFEYVVTRVAF